MIDKTKLLHLLKSHGLPAYRAKQVMDAVHARAVIDFSQITDLPSGLRDVLKNELDILCLTTEKILKSRDSRTEKILFRLHDGNRIEAVLMRFRDGRNSVCVSSQVGCRLGCRFCATGASGFNRDLDWEEIADQALYCASLLAHENKRITNVIYMGMGEPFMNYDNVLRSVRALNDKEGMNIGARNITISTSGICEGIEKLSKEKIQVNLAVSLHAPTQEIRQKIMPVAKMYPLKKLMESVQRYITATNRRVTYEYIMLKGINDGPAEAQALARLLKGQLCHINLIPYNDTGIAGITGSGAKNIKAFSDTLKRAGFPVTVRVSLGQDIDAACGQLADNTRKS